jgi:hypothetical protein
MNWPLVIKFIRKNNEPVHNGNLSATNFCPGTDDTVVDRFSCISIYYLTFSYYFVCFQMNRPIVAKCCCCISLSSGGIILGSIGIISSVVQIILACLPIILLKTIQHVAEGAGADTSMDMPMEKPMEIVTTGLVIWTVFMVIDGLMELAAGITLIIGAKKVS